MRIRAVPCRVFYSYTLPPKIHKASMIHLLAVLYDPSPGSAGCLHSSIISRRLIPAQQ